MADAVDDYYGLKETMPMMEFHKKRRIFFVMDGGVRLAPLDFNGTHYEYWVRVLNKPEADFENVVRGFILGKDIYWYKGKDFKGKEDPAVLAAADMFHSKIEETLMRSFNKKFGFYKTFN